MDNYTPTAPPAPAPRQPIYAAPKRGMSPAAIAGIVIAALLLAYGAYAYLTDSWPFATTGESTPTPSPSLSASPTPSETPLTQQELNALFEIEKKVPGTKLFYSQTLGVGFTYLDAQTQLMVSEAGTRIQVHPTGSTPTYDWQSIEVFEKDPALTLEQAVRARFLGGYDPSDCFVKVHEINPVLPNYRTGIISFPPATSPGAPWWEHADKCPQGYSETNAARYFLYNSDVPGTFIFLNLGQDSIASDGTPITPEGGRSWWASVRIVK